MKTFLALVWFEIRERRALLAAAAVASLLPLLAPLLPGTGSNPAADVREAVMWVMVLCLVPLFAVLLGVSFIGRDLSEGRLGFYFAQPLSGPTLWFGRLAAVALLIWLSQLIMMLPTVLLSPDPAPILSARALRDLLSEDWMAPAAFWVGALAVVLIAHAAGTIWRARSAWVLVDIIALLGTVTLSWLAVSPFLPFVAEDIVFISGVWIVCWVLTGLMAAGAVQLAVGRVDIRRCHRVMSMTLWGILAIATAVLLAWSVWVRSATVEDLDRLHVIATGPGSWIGVRGSSAGRFDYHPRFLVNVEDGRSVPAGPSFNWAQTELQLSDDGSKAIWLEPNGLLRRRLMTADLASSIPNPHATGVTLDDRWRDIIVSPNGGRFAVLEDNTLSVYGGQLAEQLAAVVISSPLKPIWGMFDGQNSLRVLATSRENGPMGDTRWWLLWFDVAERRLSPKVEIDMPWRWNRRSKDGHADHPLVIVTRGDEQSVVIHDPDSGAILRDLEVPSTWNLRLLANGMILVIHDRDEDDRIDLFEPTGEKVWTIDLPDTNEVFDGPLVGSDRLLLGSVNWRDIGPKKRAETSTAVLDLANGSFRELSAGRLPVLGRWGVRSTRTSWLPGSIAGRLLHDDHGRVFLLDQDTDKIEQVLPRVF